MIPMFNALGLRVLALPYLWYRRALLLLQGYVAKPSQKNQKNRPCLVVVKSWAINVFFVMKIEELL